MTVVIVEETASASLAAEEWRCLESRHQHRADDMTRAHRDRATRGERHPVEDFLFRYYSYKPALLRRWHPGEGVVLESAGDTERASWRWYRRAGSPHDLRVDAEALRTEKGALIGGIHALLVATSRRRARFGCFGLHEWAMVYRSPQIRHDVPLRLGSDATDAVVESSELACTHFDAYRFFTPAAVPRNPLPLTRATQIETEQPGCLHAGMDLYKWAVKLGPLVPGDLLLDCFELARDIRQVDMRASPYDLTDWGYTAIAIETPAGKAEYGRLQKIFSERGADLRRRLIGIAAPRASTDS
ncbi:3-methyladenine DNA glycosylase [Microbacterium aurantiacum]|uniref:3-methyladenine DNA glycosylase n=1 Tax=Microbacterium aurantiacum TaxID=162393 RepID=UPI003F496BE0